MPFERTRDLVVFLIGGIIACIDILVVYLFSVTPTAPMWLSLTVTGVLSAIIVGSYLYASRSYLLTPARRRPVQARRSGTRIAEVIVSITILGPMTVIVGTIGGALLTGLARAGGPDPAFGADEPLRRHLFRWRERNRAFLRSRGELPLRLE